MDLSAVDLNLLRVLQRLLQERHVSRTAQALGLSQPAVSNALRRLRAQLGDELLVRSSAGMQPTPLAQRLAGPLAQALELLDGALRAEAPFDPADSARAINRDVLAPRKGGRFAFGRLIDRQGARLALLPPGAGHKQVVVEDPAWLGVAEMLVRPL